MTEFNKSNWSRAELPGNINNLKERNNNIKIKGK